MKEFWNERYSEEEYVYGTEPNIFFKSQIDEVTPGKILFLGEGEGRNAVYSAKLGWIVDAYDSSEIGKEKAEKLAQKEKVEINYIVENVESAVLKENYYDVVVLIYFHTPEEIREKIHLKAQKALKSGGKIILEGFEKDQMKHNSGGPKNEEMLFSLEEIYEDFQNLELELFQKEEIELTEGKFHKGTAVVIRLVAIK